MVAQIVLGSSNERETALVVQGKEESKTKIKEENGKRRLCIRMKRFSTTSGRHAPMTRVTNCLSYQTRGRSTTRITWPFVDEIGYKADAYSDP